MKNSTLVSLLVLFACSTAITSDIQPGDADRAVETSNQRFVAAARSGDLDRLMDFYSDSVVVMPPNEAAVSGREAVRKFWSGLLETFVVSDIKLMADDVIQSGDLSVERGRFDLTLTPKAGGAAMHDSGKYLVVRRKVNGQWKAVTDMFSSNLPVTH